MLFNDIALSNLLYIEEKYRCKLVFDMMDKNVSILATKAVGLQIKKEIREKISSSFFYFLRLNSNFYKHLKSHPELIQQLV